MDKQWKKACDKFEGKDICSKCDKTAEYGTMKAVNQVSFDLICDKCRKKKKRVTNG